jgi:hypothetical protein
MPGRELLFIKDDPEQCGFKSVNNGGHRNGVPPRDRVAHGDLMLSQWRAIWAERDSLRTEASAEGQAVSDCKGCYIDFKGAAGYGLTIKSLESRSKGISLSNVMVTKDDSGKETVRATVFLPDDKKDVIGNKISAYRNKNGRNGETPKNNELVAGIESISASAFDSLWVDDKSMMPQSGGDPVWCEVWIVEPEEADSLWSNESANFDMLKIVAAELNIGVKDQLLKFPGRSVCLVFATREQLEKLMSRVGFLGELKRAKSASDYFFELPNREQAEWANDILRRLRIDNSSDVSVCVLDSGVNNGHLLLKPLLADNDCDTVNPLWRTHDSSGHGTLMCGTAAYGDLTDVLNGTRPIYVHHRLESAKILPNVGENPPELWGDLTQQAISRAEIRTSDRKRIGCMAVTASTANDVEPGRPSSWSAAVDKLVAGERDGDAPNKRRRLMFVSAGNVSGVENYRAYPHSNCSWRVEDPGQSWNAVTVGAYTRKIGFVEGSRDDLQPIAKSGELSPYSATSQTWDDDWPLKPDIILEGGNVLKDQSGDFLVNHEFASLVSTYYTPHIRHFEPFSGTSAATALAAQMAAELQARYPQATPETIRGLMVHSARWTPELIAQFKAIKGIVSSTSLSKTDYTQLVRFCGYGVPDFNRASTCANNFLTMIAQSTIQPYVMEKPTDEGEERTESKKHKRNSPILNEMAFFELPWPKNVLLAMGEKPVKLRVTLSYFIEPSPGPGGVGFGGRYSYSSFGLRFKVKKAEESESEFKARVNKLMRDNNDNVASHDGGSGRWTIGPNGRDHGSIHSDVMEHETAASLATCNIIGVYPVGGWWKDRKQFECYNRKVHYSLIVSLETDEVDCDIYTPVANMIAARVPIEVPV